MTDATALTDAQKLVPVKEALGRPWRLQPYQSVASVDASEDQITLVIRVFAYTETQREVRFTKSGLRMFSWKNIDSDWIPQPLGMDGEIALTIWDPEFKPYIECRYGVHRSVAEHYDRLEWEAQVHRPGTKRTPLDSYERTVYASPDETTPNMFKYWTGVDRQLEVLFRSERQD